jgi:hypothetical protein
MASHSNMFHGQQAHALHTNWSQHTTYPKHQHRVFWVCCRKLDHWPLQSSCTLMAGISGVWCQWEVPGKECVAVLRLKDCWSKLEQCPVLHPFYNLKQCPLQHVYNETKKVQWRIVSFYFIFYERKHFNFFGLGFLKKGPISKGSAVWRLQHCTVLNAEDKITKKEKKK